MFSGRANFFTFDVANVGPGVNKPYNIRKVPAMLVFKEGKLAHNKGIFYD
jgi:hypothetical protein